MRSCQASLKSYEPQRLAVFREEHHGHAVKVKHRRQQLAKTLQDSLDIGLYVNRTRQLQQGAVPAITLPYFW